MAKKGGTVLYDAQHNIALAGGEQTNSDEIKEKVNKVRSVYPFISKDSISMILKGFEYDVNATLDAISEKGHEHLLSEWNCAGNNKFKIATKNKKKKKKAKKESLGSKNLASIRGSGDEEVNNNNTSKTDSIEDSPSVSSEVSSTVITLDNTSDLLKQNGDIHEDQAAGGDAQISETLSSKEDDSSEIEKTESQEPEEDTHGKSRFSPSSEGSNRSRNNSVAESSVSKDSDQTTTFESMSSSSSNSTIPRKKGLEKTLKDLSRTTASLHRIQNLLEEQLNKSERMFRTAFSDVRKMLDERQADLEKQMEKVKNESRELLGKRQNLGAELKTRAERLATMPENEVLELKDEIKQFVVERKHDDELGKTVWFVWSPDEIALAVKKLGEVEEVKMPYSHRKLSQSSATSSANQDTGSTVCVASSPVSGNPDIREEKELTNTKENRTENTASSNVSKFERPPRVFTSMGHRGGGYRGNPNARFMRGGRGGRGMRRGGGMGGRRDDASHQGGGSSQGYRGYNSDRTYNSMPQRDLNRYRYNSNNREKISGDGSSREGSGGGYSNRSDKPSNVNGYT